MRLVRHEAEVGDEHRISPHKKTLLSQKWPCSSCPWQPRRQPGLARRDQFGEPLCLAGHAPFGRCRVLAQHLARFDVVGEFGGSPRRGHHHIGEQGMDTAQDRQPQQSVKGAHRRHADEPFHLDSWSRTPPTATMG